jgi:hypothetical protein
MNNQIETWRVQQYAANILHLFQQEGSRLKNKGIRSESFVGKSEFFDRLGLATAQDKSGRNSDTPNLDIAHSRRMVTTVTREWGTLVDRKDKLQNIHMPESEYAKAAAAALGRKADSILINAGLGVAYTGESGSTSQTLGNAQKVAAVESSALDYANVQVLRKAKLLMDQGEVSGKRYFVCGADFIEQLLAQTEVTSSDFNTVRALASGELNSFLGFEFIRTEIIGDMLAASFDADTFKWNATTGLYDSGGTTIAATDKVAMAYAEGAILMGENTGGRISRIEERADKSYSMQVYSAMDLGAVRMQEEGVVQVIYKA